MTSQQDSQPGAVPTSHQPKEAAMHPSAIESSPSQETRQSKSALRTALLLRLASFGIVVALCLVVSLFALLTHRLDGNAQALNPNTPADWQTYRDPLGLFSVRMPKAWTASVETSKATVSDGTRSATETLEQIRLSDPALGDASAQVYVVASPIRNDFEREWYCEFFADFGHENPPHNLSPQTLSPGPFLFDSTDAHFDVYAVIPHILEPPQSGPLPSYPQPTLTPLPQQVIATDRTILATILNSFQPADSTPLSC